MQPHLFPSLLSASLMLGCAHTGASSSDEPEAPLRYGFKAHSAVSSSLYAPDGSELAAGLGPELHTRWSGQLEQRPTRRFKDGSQGDQVQFLEVSMQRGDQPPFVSELSGLSVELRSFTNREVLEIDLLDHLVGGDRAADLMLPLWPALSPRVPDLDPGQSVRSRSNLPFMLASGMGAPIALDLHWTLEGPQPCGDLSCWHLVYEGPVMARGLERTERWHARYRMEGQASGELWLRVDDNSILDSQLTLDLTIRTTLSDPATQVPTAVLKQQHRQQARVRAAGSPE
jgi:hypothetical protein